MWLVESIPCAGFTRTFGAYHNFYKYPEDASCSEGFSKPLANNCRATFIIGICQDLMITPFMDCYRVGAVVTIVGSRLQSWPSGSWKDVCQSIKVSNAQLLLPKLMIVCVVFHFSSSPSFALRILLGHLSLITPKAAAPAIDLIVNRRHQPSSSSSPSLSPSSSEPR